MCIPLEGIRLEVHLGGGNWSPTSHVPLLLLANKNTMYKIFLFALGLLVLKIVFPELTSAIIDLLLQIIKLIADALAGLPPPVYGGG